MYPSRVACRVCGITPRTLDYWITTAVIAPSKALRTRRQGRKYFLFSFDDLVQIKIVKSLRDEGISLGAIRSAIKRLRGKSGRSWHREWLCTDGKGLYRVTKNTRVLESLRKKDSGQLTMSIVAVDSVRQWVERKLAKVPKLDPSRFDADLLNWGAASSYG